MQRYIIVHSEMFEKVNYRFVYDRKFKTFVIVQRFGQNKFNKTEKDLIWQNEMLAPSHFYVYFPGFAKNYRESNKLPNWK